MKRILFTIALIYIAISGSVGQSAIAVSQVNITVSDLDKLVPFYTQVLPFKLVGTYELKGEEAQQLFGMHDPGLVVKVARMQLENEIVELMEFKTMEKGNIIPPDSRSNDLWFQHIAIVVSDMQKAYEFLKASKVQFVSSAPQKLPDYLPAAAGISAFYFRDPDGHNLEIIHFPEGKGNPKWPQPTDKLFLGIDHTAIGISDTDQAIAFYQNLLGLKVAGNSENYGPEQEHLNMVFGAHLQITGLTAQYGFGLEFLDYLSPPGGKNYPENSKPSDLWHWHTAIQVENLERTFEMLKNMGIRMISEDIISIKIPYLNVEKAFLVKDIDGHVILIYQ